MPQERVSVRKIREMLRLHYGEKLSNRQVGTSVGKSPSVVHDCLARFKASGLAWPLDAALNDAALERRLYPPSVARIAGAPTPPDFACVHKELSRKHMTLALLWREYRDALGEAGYQYSRFCELYREWAKPLGAVLRRTHKAGDKAFVDWSGDGVEIVDRETGEVREAPLFVAALGASGYAFAKAAPSRESEHWIRLHCEMLEHFGGVTAAVVPDNEKTGVTSPCRYDPDLNPVYAAWAEHYDTTVLPARAGKPRDKAVVENAVLNVQRWILARLRNHTFFTLEQANAEIARLLIEYNGRKLQKLDATRCDLFEELDKPVLKPLPARRFEHFGWSTPKLPIHYHVVADERYYSAPYTLIGKHVEVRTSGSTVEIFHDGRRVAAHARSYGKRWDWHTLPEHRPPSHRAYLEWTPERFVRWASKAGPKAAELVERILAAHGHPERGYNACLGVMRLGKQYGEARLEAACDRAVSMRSPSYKTVQSILKSGADHLPPPMRDRQQSLALPRHENIRGPEYYR